MKIIVIAIMTSFIFKPAYQVKYVGISCNTSGKTIIKPMCRFRSKSRKTQNIYYGVEIIRKVDKAYVSQLHHIKYKNDIHTYISISVNLFEISLTTNPSINHQLESTGVICSL